MTNVSVVMTKMMNMTQQKPLQGFKAVLRGCSLKSELGGLCRQKLAFVAM